jgi:hypothetical protein
MIFSIIIIIAALAVAYFHYVQGLFSATLSALIAVIAAVLAVSYFETVVNAFSKGRFADQADGLVLVILFAAIYIVLRLIFDKAVRGNVRYPVLMDKIGAGVMGLIAGICAAGVLAIAAQTLPFGPVIGGYTRYQTNDERHAEVVNPHGGQALDANVYDETKGDTLESSGTSSMLLPADDMVVGLVRTLSEGSLAGERPLTAIHPDLLGELFGQRLGIQVGAKHVAQTSAGPQANVKGLANLYSIDQVDAELPKIRGKRDLDRTLRPEEGQMILVVRVIFTGNAADVADKIVRLSPGAVRLVAGGHNYHPLGTMEGGLLYANRVDDPIFIDVSQADKGADFVFLAKAADVLTPSQPNPRTVPLNVAQDVFVEVKRGTRLDLSGMSIDPKLPSSDAVAVMRKPGVGPKAPAPAPATKPAEPTITPPGAPGAPGGPPGVMPPGMSPPTMPAK